MMRQTSHESKDAQENPHLLIPMSSHGITGENDLVCKIDQKIEITGVTIAWVDVKSTKYPLFHI